MVPWCRRELIAEAPGATGKLPWGNDGGALFETDSEERVQ